MKNKFVLSILLLVLASGLIWAQFWKDYSDTERQKVGESYWLAGKQYKAVGKAEKGDEYMAFARIIYPDLDPAAIKDESLPSAAELLAQGRATAIGGGAETLPSASLNSFFLRFAGAVTEKDPASVAGFLDGTVYVSDTDADVTAADLASSFAAVPRGMKPSSLYDLSSIVVTRTEAATWGDAYALTVSSPEDLSGTVSVWSAEQKFYIHREAGGWYIFAYGQAPPPATWTPRPATSAAAAAPEAAPREADASKALIETFTTCMTALLSKDADGALACMSQDIRFLRLRQTVTRDELKTSLLGFYDNPAFTEEPLTEVMDMDSIFVHSVQSPVESVSGTVYELNVQAKADLSSLISFWTTYQKYYFVQENGEWVVFAIL